MTIVAGDLNYPLVYSIITFIIYTIYSTTPTNIAPESTLLSSHPVTLLIQNYHVTTLSYLAISNSTIYLVVISYQPTIYSHLSITYSLPLSLL